MSIGTKLGLLHNHRVNWNQTWSSPQSQCQLEPNLVFSTIRKDQVWFQLTLWLWRRPSLVPIDPVIVEMTKFGSNYWPWNFVEDHLWFQLTLWLQTLSFPQSQGQLEPTLVFCKITGSIGTKLGLLHNVIVEKTKFGSNWPCEFWEEQVWFQLLTLWFWRRPSLVPIDPVIVLGLLHNHRVNWNQTWSSAQSQCQLEPN
jgi:hypothetical protein